MNNTSNTPQRTTYVWALICLLFLFSIANTIVYYAYRISFTSSIIILCAGLVLLFFGRKKIEAFQIKKCFTRESAENYLMLGAFLIIESTLFFLLFKNQNTTDISNSPWLHLPYLFFILYAIGTALTLALTQKVQNTWIAYTATSLHIFLTYAIVVIIYPLGYGFDGFIHRATEQWIQTHGYILPKQPVYVGQYSLIVFLSHITRLPIFYIDVFFVPFLSALFLPRVIAKTLKAVWSIPERAAINLTWVLPIIFYISLHLTTPHNVLLLLFIITIFATLAFMNNKLTAAVPLILGIAGLGIHALLGAPIFLFVITAIILKNYTKYRTALLVSYTVILIFLFPMLFTLFFWLSGKPLPELSNPLSHLYSFLDLFRLPYWYEKDAGFFWNFLYLMQRVLPFILTLGAVLSFLYIGKKKKIADIHILFLLSFIGFWIGAYLLRSWIIFPDVGAYEQGDYPLRLIKSSIIFLLPWLMYGVYLVVDGIAQKIRRRFSMRAQKIFYVCFLCVCAIVITRSFYFAYPQENKKVHFPGYNVTQADFSAARWIDADNTQYNYIVLSNPLTAIAAMTQFGFPKYFETAAGLHSYYSIPSGGRLFSIYQKMLYEGQRREFMDEAMNFTGVDKSYFVISSFWSNFKQIVEGAKKTADSWQVIDQGKIWIFVYTK